MTQLLESPIKKYLAHFHGAPHDPSKQYSYYRCELCRGVVTWKQIEAGGCKCGTGSRVRAAHLSFSEKARILLMPWSV